QIVLPPSPLFAKKRFFLFLAEDYCEGNDTFYAAMLDDHFKTTSFIQKGIELFSDVASFLREIYVSLLFIRLLLLEIGSEKCGSIRDFYFTQLFLEKRLQPAHCRSK
ncbi:hypothetical protein TSAR_015973, partial [Trichomalopsis sarcophagae]